jgi:hypothetical protein
LIICYQIICGTEPFPTERKAKKYKIENQYFTKVCNIQILSGKILIFKSQEDFVHIMKNLPVVVEDEDIDEMFEFADKDRDGKLSYEEFQVTLDMVENDKVLIIR